MISMSETYERYQTKEFAEIAVSAIRNTSDEQNFGRGDPEKDPEVKILAENIKQHGLLQPITVIETQDSTAEKREYETVIGNRRLATFKIAFPEKETIKSLVLPKDTTTTRKDMLTVSENLMRLNYTAIDRAKIIAKILPYWGDDKLRLAKALGYETIAVINEWLEMLEVEADVIGTLKGPVGLVAKRARLIKKLPRALQIPVRRF